MKLNLTQIREITVGAEEIAEQNGVFTFERYTAAQRELQKALRPADHVKKSGAAAGVRMAFTTDSKSLSFSYVMMPGSSRNFGYFDVFADGVLCGHFGGEGEVIEGTVDMPLPGADVLVEVYFPWSKAARICDVALDDGAKLIPHKRAMTMLTFGDSITHGYDAIYPSMSYASQLARLMNADQVNKAIGGDVFFAELAASDESFTPDLITVAYGTNDWCSQKRSTFERHCRAFFDALCEKYPTSKIFAITPIWRADANRETPFGAPCSTVDSVMRGLLADIPNLTAIRGWELVPHHEGFFSDRFLHPNDLGFCEYARNLYTEIGAL